MNLHIITRKVAKQFGLKRYYTGKPCVKGHVEERLTSTGQCYGCLRSDEYIKVKKDCDKRHYTKNKYKILKQLSDYRQKNKEAISQRLKKHYQKSKQKRLAYHKIWAKQNSEKLKQYQKNWRHENRDVCNAHNAKHFLAKKNRTPSWLTGDQLKAIKTEYSLATWCSKVMGIKYHVDHIIPLRGKLVSGLHVPWNLQVIPALDNLIKSNQYGIEGEAS
jgi:hypothetical protein